jgi:hypothetical protein
MAASVAEPSEHRIPWFLDAVLFSSTSIILGLIWDICWHRTVGRDTFWSPPHMAIYAGGIVAGVASAAVILRSTFFGGGTEPRRGVRIWGLTGPLGAFCCSWGAGAMLTSAPFDDWWHNAYGLDVTILSPPHAVLALGIMAIQVGAMVTAVAFQNRAQGSGQPGARLPALRARYIYSAGLLFTSATILVYERSVRALMHSSSFYLVSAGLFAFLFLAAARASCLRWPATWTAAVYTGILLAQLWILPLVPAEPRLGPVRHHVDHFIPLQFPLLVLVPAFALDLILRRLSSKPPWVTAAVAGGGFLAVFLAVQWPFADFLMSPPSRNFFFGTHEYPYYLSLEVFLRRQQFVPDPSATALLGGLTLAFALSVISSRFGLAFGSWMSRVQR